MAWHSWRPYVPVAQRRMQAAAKMTKLRKKGVDIQPIRIDGRKIARTFWGEAWCDHLESFSDYANRLPRGRTYVRNGSVCHLAISKGKIEAKVSGSDLYNLNIKIKALPKEKWLTVKRRCAGQIASLLELLQGRLSDHVMTVVTDRKNGLFPTPGEISFDCDCPDWAVMCKHVAAVLYGVGARLDEQPELLFKLRGVNHEELIDADAGAAVTAATSRGGKSKRIAADELSDVFGIELDAGNADDAAPAKARKAAKESKSPVRRKAKLKVAGNVSKTTATKSAASAAVKKKVAKKPGRTKAGKVARKDATLKPITGAQAVLHFVQGTGGATTAEIVAHWKLQGRGGKVDNTITKLVLSNRLRRQAIKGARGSRYTIV